jgi:proteasome lid subunit RPN8/RPN11
MEEPSVATLPPDGKEAADAIEMSAELCLRLLDTAQRFHRAGFKSFGLLTADPGTARHPFHPTDVEFLDPLANRRNDQHYRLAFEAQGEYFQQFDDAGFVADPSDLLSVCRKIEDAGREIVAPFHIHRRQPPNFSLIDYRLHNPAFSWHLIISLRDPLRPELQPFRVHKRTVDFGISDRDAMSGSELAYGGPEVCPLPLVLYGTPAEIGRLANALQPTPSGSPLLHHCGAASTTGGSTLPR